MELECAGDRKRQIVPTLGRLGVRVLAASTSPNYRPDGCETGLKWNLGRWPGPSLLGFLMSLVLVLFYLGSGSKPCNTQGLLRAYPRLCTKGSLLAVLGGGP